MPLRSIHKSQIRFSLLLGLIFLFSCNKTDEFHKINRIASKNELPDIRAHDLSTYYSKNGIIEGQLETPVMMQYQLQDNSYSLFPNGVTLKMFDKKHNIKTIMRADSAIYYDKQEKWEAYHNIVIVNDIGDSLLTDLLYGDQKLDQIYTDLPVEIRKTDGNKIQGQGGFRSNFAFTAYKFMNVDGLIFFNEADTTSNKPKTEISDKKTPKLVKKKNLRREKPQMYRKEK